MKYVFIILIGMLLTACGSRQVEPYDFCDEPAPIKTTNKEDFLVIGDSVSIGYTPTLVQNFPNYEVIHNPCNGRTSVNGLKRIDGWLDMRPRFKVITFNHGLWDIAKVYDVSVDAYKTALRIEGQKLKAKADVVLFVNTTEVLPGTDNRYNSDVLTYNQAAQEIMQELNIPVCDLYSISTTIPISERLGPQDVHFTEVGYRVLGDAITQCLNNLGI